MKTYLKLAAAGFVSLVFTLFAGASTCSNQQMKASGSSEASPMSAVVSGPVGTAPDLTPAAEASVHAVVHIKVQGKQKADQQFIDPFDFFFGGGRGQQQQMRPVVGYGSGVIISPDGYIITNNHVVENADEITVTLNDNREFKAKPVGADAVTDIAVIKVDTKGLPTLPIGDSDKLRLGEWVLAVGNPFNLTSTVTAGIVSAKARAATSQRDGKMNMDSFIQTDAAVNPGNSGGALVNAHGELVGINTMIYSQTGQFAGYSFAVPINVAAKVADDLRKYGSVQRAVIGIVGGDITPDLRKEYDLKVNEGVVVTDFSEVSSALASGIRKGDVIVGINDRSIKSMAMLTEQVNRFRPGDKIRVKVDRKGEAKSFEVTLKNIQGGTSIVKSEGIEKLLGAKFTDIDAGTLQSYGVSYGVRVAEVGTGKLKKAGVNPGLIILSVNNQPIPSVSDLGRAVQRVQGNSKSDRTLLIKGFYPQDGNVRLFAIDLAN